jgi:hypothetical protein
MGTFTSYIPIVMGEVERLNSIMYQMLYSLSEYFTDNWTFMDIFNFGAIKMGEDKSYIVENNFILSPITNIVENMKLNQSQMNFSPIMYLMPLPYT